MQRKQKRGRFLFSEQVRFDERRLAASFVEMAGALKARPEPRQVFDDAASPGRVSYRGLVLVLSGRAVMREAIRTGDRDVIEESARRVAHHFDEAKSAALVEYHRYASGATSLADAVDAASRETCDLEHALAHFALAHDATAVDDVKREIDREMMRLVELRQSLGPAANVQPLSRRVQVLS